MTNYSRNMYGPGRVAYPGSGGDDDDDDGGGDEEDLKATPCQATPLITCIQDIQAYNTHLSFFVAFNFLFPLDNV